MFPYRTDTWYSGVLSAVAYLADYLDTNCSHHGEGIYTTAL